LFGVSIVCFFLAAFLRGKRGGSGILTKSLERVS
jgi:hypothetical protein